MSQFSQMPQFPKLPKLGLKNIGAIILALIVFLIILDGLVSVPAGYVGIIFDRGRGVLEKELPAGLHLKIPFWQVSYLMDARTQAYTMSVTPGEGAVYTDDSMTAPTADGQTVTVDATVLFHINKDKASKLFKNIGPNYIQKIVRPIARSQIRAEIANYSAIDVYAKRRDEAEKQINERIRKLYSTKDITLEQVLLRHIAFSPQYAQVIEDKQVAQQLIQKADFQRQEAEKLKAKKIIEAEADAEAIRLKGETLRRNPQVIQFEFVQKMAKDIRWGILPSNILPLLNFNQK